MTCPLLRYATLRHVFITPALSVVFRCSSAPESPAIHCGDEHNSQGLRSGHRRPKRALVCEGGASASLARQPWPLGQGGFTFIEILVGVLILGVMTGGVMGLAVLGVRVASINEQRVVALGIANEQAEFIRTLSYGDLSCESGPLSCDQMVVRGGRQYDVQTVISVVDDPGAEGAEDYKQVLITVTVPTSLTDAPGSSVEVFTLVVPGGSVGSLSCMYVVDSDDGFYSSVHQVNFAAGGAVSLAQLWGGAGSDFVDFKGFDIRPTTGVIYVASDGQGFDRGWVYQISAETGSIIDFIDTGFNAVGLTSLAFRPNGELWAWAEGQGLITVDIDGEGVGSQIVLPDATTSIHGLAWNNDGTQLYGVGEALLYQFNPDPGTGYTLKDLEPDWGPVKLKGLDFGPSGLLVMSGDVVNNSPRDILVYDLAANGGAGAVVSPHAVDDIADLLGAEAVAWSTSCLPPPVCEGYVVINSYTEDRELVEGEGLVPVVVDEFYQVNIDAVGGASATPLWEGIDYSFYDFEGFAIDPVDGTLYVVSDEHQRPLPGGGNTDERGWVYTIDPNDGSVVPRGDSGFNGIEGLAFHPDGTLWGWAEDKGLVTVNKVSGQATLVGVINSTDIQGLAWNREEPSELHGVSKDGKLYRIDKDSGFVTEAVDLWQAMVNAGYSSSNQELGALAFGPGGLLVVGQGGGGPSAGRIFTYDLGTGDVVLFDIAEFDPGNVEAMISPGSCAL